MASPDKVCRVCGGSRPATEDFCPYCTAIPLPTLRRERSASSAIGTGLETRWGGGPENPTPEEMQAALAELATPDPEHPDTWLTDDDGFTVIVYESGLVIFSDADRELCRRQGITREEALELWLLLQQGRRDTILQRLSA